MWEQSHKSHVSAISASPINYLMTKICKRRVFIDNNWSLFLGAFSYQYYQTERKTSLYLGVAKVSGIWLDMNWDQDYYWCCCMKPLKVNMIKIIWYKLPKISSMFINWWTIVTWNFARFVLVMACYFCLRETAWLEQWKWRSYAPENFFFCFSYTVFIQVPLAHLLEEFQFVVLIGGPTHMKDVCIYFTFHYLLHKIFSPMIMPTSWKFNHIST